VIVHLYSPTQATTVMKDLWPKVKESLALGKKMRLEIKQSRRSTEQNDMFHSIIAQIAQKMGEAGSTWTADDWKRLLIDQWAHETGRKIGKVAPSLDGERVVQLGLQSHKFTVEDSSEFIEFLIAWATNKGIDV
jgi:NinB protein